MGPLLTLKWYSKLTRKGKLMACRILFSFSVCSTCFNLTTCTQTLGQQRILRWVLTEYYSVINQYMIKINKSI